ncbi:PD-(D/E)XK nuclease family protein [Plesiomonas shigelloides]|uniref:PDDEXK-like family protein n=1 Tax=Plesiomonas shigelloides TaxID=703 RepID=UPI00057ABACE|nr:PD-(D/E)XK nuclease family protein [Plesiomonas shigelloides]
MDTHLSRFEQLLTEYQALTPVAEVEPNLFSIGGKGYYENPTTDILAFFCNTNGPHPLGDSVLNALLHCLPDDYHALDNHLIHAPEREVTTPSGKRIDLLLESDGWVMVLENKIFHQQNNPFTDYEDFIKHSNHQTRFADKDALFVVLSPSGETLPDGWHGISYPALTEALKTELANQFFAQPINKWTLLLREFILHLESLMSQPTVNSQTLNFVLNNLGSIKALQDTKQQAINTYHTHLQSALQAQLGTEISIRLHHWDGLPALRFGLSDWHGTDSDVVLYLSTEKDESVINVYARLNNHNNEAKADHFILNQHCIKRWVEGNGKYRGYQVSAAKMEETQIVKFIAERLQELDRFEQAKLGATE